MANKKKAGSKNRLSELHAMFTELLMDEMKLAKQEGIPVSAADKSVIAKFLKDNMITADIDDDRMDSLRDEFQDELAIKREERRQQLLSKLDASEADQALDDLLG